MTVDVSHIKKFIKKHCKKKGSLISLLQDIQNVYGYVPHEAIEIVAKELEIFPVQIYGVLTFYTQFYFTPRGKHTIKVCHGTACHVMGGKEILKYVSDKLGINEGETTQNGLFSLERVACLGCCGMAPVVVIEDNVYGNCTYQKINFALKKYKSKKGDRNEN